MGTMKYLRCVHPGKALILAFLAMLVLPGTVLAIGLDGNFDDWNGQPNIPDPIGDGTTNNTDLTAFYWTMGAGADSVYFMFERISANGPVYFEVDIDCNNNGSFGDVEDRRVIAFYQPANNEGPVSVSVVSGQGGSITGFGGNWGETKGQGGSRAELGVSFADLGIDGHTPINMTAMAGQNSGMSNADDLTPDGGTITWTPIPVLGWLLLGIGMAVVIGVAWHKQGRFMWGATSSSAS
jgi:hypothetical protein